MTDIRAIIFDLDDTLVNTFELLVTPLEEAAAGRMRQVDSALPAADELAALFLETRKNCPRRLEEAIRRRLPGIKDQALTERQKVFKSADPCRLSIDPTAKQLLRDLGDHYHLFLLTQGDPAFQNRKIDHLKIRHFFKDVVITSPDGGEGKGEAIQWLLAYHGYVPEAVVVVGNRLDIEIRVASRLGLRTVWLKNGEGCCLSPGETSANPHHTINNILHLRQVFPLP
jgi:FMN phosphatase YigB (HAD superfamily)